MVEAIIKLIQESNLNVFDRNEIYQALIKNSDWSAECDSLDPSEAISECSDGELVDEICCRYLSSYHKSTLKDEFFDELSEIDEFDDEELLDELKQRDFDDNDIVKLNKVVFNNITDKKEFRCEISVPDKTIVVDSYSEFIKKIFELKDDFSYNELQIKLL